MLHFKVLTGPLGTTKVQVIRECEGDQEFVGWSSARPRRPCSRSVFGTEKLSALPGIPCGRRTSRSLTGPASTAPAWPSVGVTGPGESAMRQSRPCPSATTQRYSHVTEEQAHLVVKVAAGLF
jgi:hypothetical protein